MAATASSAAGGPPVPIQAQCAWLPHHWQCSVRLFCGNLSKGGGGIDKFSNVATNKGDHHKNTPQSDVLLLPPTPLLIYSCRYPKYSRLTLLLYPSLLRSRGLWDVRRLTGYEPFCCLAFGSAAEHQSPSAGEGEGIYSHPFFALHPRKQTDPLNQVD